MKKGILDLLLRILSFSLKEVFFVIKLLSFKSVQMYYEGGIK